MYARDLGVERDGRRGRRRDRPPSRATSRCLTSCPTTGASSRSSSRRECGGVIRSLGRDRPAVGAGDGERQRLPRSGRGSVSRIATPTSGCAAIHGSRAVDPSSPRPRSGDGSAIAAASARAGRPDRNPGLSPGAASAARPPSPVGSAGSRRRWAPRPRGRRRASTASKSSESWSPPPPVGARRPCRPQPDGRAAPTTRAAGTRPIVATPRSAAAARSGDSPVIAGSRSTSVRNSYSRKSRMTSRGRSRRAWPPRGRGRPAGRARSSPARAQEDRLAVLAQLVAQLARASPRRGARSSPSSVPNSPISFAAVFSPTPGDARDVVGRVALERLEVDHLVGPQPVPLVDPRRVVDDRVLDAHPGRHQAASASVTSWSMSRSPDTIVVSRPRLRLDGERADDVVGLVALQLVDRDAAAADDLADLRELVAQVVRHALRGSPCTRRTARGGTSGPGGRRRPRRSPA